VTPCAQALTLGVALALALLAVVIASLPALRWLSAVAALAIVAWLVAVLSNRKDKTNE
jgi:hypothetical protein